MPSLHQPLRFAPLLKQTIWGGRKLGDRLGKTLGQAKDYAESWEIVDHGADQSVVIEGDFEGLSLKQLFAEFREDLMGPHSTGESFPLLLKYLDCNRVLSVQVHPDDAYGQRMTPPDLGKTEAWYIVDAEPGAKVYAGLKEGVTREALAAAIEAGQTEQTLHAFEPSVGDVLFIPAGTVHALGAGLLVAEIQQSSDTTFRLFDWNRTDDSGKSRPLHIGPALEVTDYSSGPVRPRRCDPSRAGWQTAVECEKFVLKVLHRGSGLVGDHPGFEIVTVPSGEAVLQTDAGNLRLPTGASALIPASASKIEITVVASDSSATPLVLSAHLP